MPEAAWMEFEWHSSLDGRQDIAERVVHIDICLSSEDAAVSTISRSISGLLVAIAISVSGDAAFADIYVSRDSNGHLVYSDRKPAGASQTVRVESRPSVMSPAAASNSAAAGNWEQAESARKEKARVAEQERLVLLEERARRCAEAKKQSASYAINGPRCSYDGNGGRSCLSAAEIDSKRAEANRQMAEFCAR
jgi:hypothetical protein